jgi:hypothetical protein
VVEVASKLSRAAAGDGGYILEKYKTRIKNMAIIVCS